MIHQDRPTEASLRNVPAAGSGCAVSCVPLLTSNGVGVVQSGFTKFTRRAPGEGVAAALGDRVDHAAGETAVFGGNARRQHLRLLDGVFDEQVLRLREQVVVHVDAVDHEDVVEGHCAVDDHLPGVGRVLRDAGRQRCDPLERARCGERLNLLVLEVGADDRCGNRRWKRRGDLHLFAHAGRLNRRVLFDGETERQRRRPRHVSEPAQRELQRVGARRQGRERVIAFGVGDRRARALQRG